MPVQRRYQPAYGGFQLQKAFPAEGRHVRQRGGIAHVFQFRNPAEGQGEQQIIGFVQLLLGVIAGNVQPGFHRAGNDAFQHEGRAGLAHAQVAVSVHVGDGQGLF